MLDLVQRIAERVGIEVREEVKSPGAVYLECRWLRGLVRLRRSLQG